MLAPVDERSRDRLIGSMTAASVDAELMQQLDRIHAQLGAGFAPIDALSGYLAFLEAVPQGMRFGPKVTVALALLDNVLAMDELKLEHRKLRRALEGIEAATYELLVRIGQRHAHIIGCGEEDERKDTQQSCDVQFA
jgi:hypothetical protein